MAIALIVAKMGMYGFAKFVVGRNVLIALQQMSSWTVVVQTAKRSPRNDIAENYYSAGNRGRQPIYLGDVQDGKERLRNKKWQQGFRLSPTLNLWVVDTM